jgi:hypothetical protein
MVQCDQCAKEFPAANHGGKAKRFCSKDCKEDYRSKVVRKMMNAVIEADREELRIKGLEADFLPKRMVQVHDDKGKVWRKAIARDWIGTVTERQLDNRAKAILKKNKEK